MKTPQKTGGFTLLEILVSLSIIGILTSVIYFSFDTARESSRNKAMMAEVKETQLAIELYRAQNGRYPLPNSSGSCGAPFPVSGALFSTDTGACAGSYIQGLAPTYIAELPSIDDAANSQCILEYRTAPDGSWYKLTAIECLSSGTMTIDDEMARCPGSCGNCADNTLGNAYQNSDNFTQSFAVYSLGGQCE